MSTLKALANAQQEILTAELAALLHDLGKLSSMFILHSSANAPTGSKYHVERIISPQKVISIQQSENEIRNLEPFKLALALLNQPNWGTQGAAAQAVKTALEGMAKKGSSPKSAKGMREWLFKAMQNSRDPESALPVVCSVYGACKLHDLLHESPSNDHRYPYEQFRDNDVQFLSNTRTNILGYVYSLGELITLMWDEFHIRDRKPIDTGDPSKDKNNRIFNEYARCDTLSRWIGKQTFLPRYLITCHGSVSGEEKAGVLKKKGTQLANETYAATVFGYEGDRSCVKLTDLDVLRGKLFKKLLNGWNKFVSTTNSKEQRKERGKLTLVFRKALGTGLGETRRPVNDISLWDYAWSIAALFKSAVAQAVLKDSFEKETSDLRWRLLTARLDGLKYLLSVEHVSDLIGRKNLLEEALDAFRDVIELEVPLGNEIYKDENGIIMVVPDVKDIQSQKLNGNSLQNHLIEKLDQTGVAPLEGEVGISPVLESERLGMRLNVDQVLKEHIELPPARRKSVKRWWQDAEGREICIVCGLRPVGYGVEKLYPNKKSQSYHRMAAHNRKVCGYCLRRREGRSKQWANEIGQPTNLGRTTIWIDEVADDNARVALLIGQFDIDNWLSGDYLRTLITRGDEPPSIQGFARELKKIAKIERPKKGDTRTEFLDEVDPREALFPQGIKILDSLDEILRRFGREDLFNPSPNWEKIAELIIWHQWRKEAAFGRLHRVWETTRTFWKEVLPTGEEANIKGSEVGQLIGERGPRLAVVAANMLRDQMGDYHAYELNLGPTKLSVVWDPKVQGGRLISAGNLSYVALQLGWRPPKITPSETEAKIQTHRSAAAAKWLCNVLNREVEEKTFIRWPISLEIDGAKEPPEGKETVSLEQVRAELIRESSYFPVVPILSEPRTFMALVPGGWALPSLHSIKEKYEKEMGKVRNRLPLHIGIVYADRHTPLRAILEAGRRMLELQASEKTWRIYKTPSEMSGNGLDSELTYLKQESKQFSRWLPIEIEQDGRRLVWRVPYTMGDGNTQDDWYPYVFVETNGNNNKIQNRERKFKAMRPKEDGTTEPCWLVHAAELKAGDEIYFTPSTFDFEFLDVAGRRFEIYYDKDGRRPDRPCRPYLLEDVARLKKIWNLISDEEKGLTNTQINALLEVIEKRRKDWNVITNSDDTFQQFVYDAVREGWRKEGWKNLSEEEKKTIKDSATSGMLADVVELYMKIMKQHSKKIERR